MVLLLGELIDMKLTREEAEVLLMIFGEWEMGVEGLGDSDIDKYQGERERLYHLQDKLMDFAL